MAEGKSFKKRKEAKERIIPNSLPLNLFQNLCLIWRVDDWARCRWALPEAPVQVGPVQCSDHRPEGSCFQVVSHQAISGGDVFGDFTCFLLEKLIKDD
jgi:hypothetical protein